MEKYKQDEFIEFDYNGETLYCRITDNNEPIRIVRGVEKMSSGTVEEMTNITSFTVTKWYAEYLEKKEIMRYKI